MGGESVDVDQQKDGLAMRLEFAVLLDAAW